MSNDVLVSICVITYNSSATVLETLESIKEQTYNYIELIISDDCSTDNTIQICNEWLSKNKDRFVKSILITTEKNTGIPANANRAVKQANGEWIKLIAGDDCLASNGIKEFIFNYKGEDLIVACQYQSFIVDENGEKKYYDIGPSQYAKKKLLKSANQQFKDLLLENFITAPSIIINHVLFEKIGFFDESYRYMEDYPFWLKCTLYGYKISYLPILIVYYRRSYYSITNRRNNIFHNGLYHEEIKLYKEQKHKYASNLNLIYWDVYLNYRLRYFIIVKILNNKKSKLNVFINRLLFYFTLLNIYKKICHFYYTKSI